MVYLLTFTTIVFRGDTAVLFAPILLAMLISRPSAFFSIIQWGITASVASLALTVVVDSYFWYDTLDFVITNLYGGVR